MRRDNNLKGFDASLDRVVEQAIAQDYELPSVLYHYTTPAGLAGILKDMALRARSHKTTNDASEFQVADEAVQAAAGRLMRSGPERHRMLFRDFLKHYETLRAWNHLETRLTCFSTARDSAHFWHKDYTNRGRGYCLGIRLLPGERFELAGWQLALGRGQYGTDGLEHDIYRAFRRVAAEVERWHSRVTYPHLRAMAFGAVNRISAGIAVLRKTEDWEAEKEWRRIAFLRDSKILPKDPELLPLRLNGARISIAEVIVGPGLEHTSAQELASDVLRQAGYAQDSSEWPQITCSTTA